ncbi:VWA domain-containing protein [Deinococcus sp. Arct2-2]|uniref:vWA domain-containing protein n=1 Tax=Deinococcus sp. Arct2-2 TaxID=2568653 RepID=UPI0010A49103|nr:vWA domain-containing protein [Deinococcus sp. Arct2-2]THF71895.1 VWA domain-containing protein [Deinococcus sp. Arct2-2]
MTYLHKTALALTTALLTLASCGPDVPNVILPTIPAATVLQINGTRVLNATSIQFGVTALNGTTVVGTGQITNPAVAFTTPGVTGSVSVCGQITAQNVVTAAVTLDATGSMSSTDPAENRKLAAKAFVDRLTGDSQAAVLSFEASSTPTAGLLASRLQQAMTGDKALLNMAIDNATYASGSTNFYDAVIDAVKIAKDSGRSNPIVLALTDGEDNSSNNTATEAIAYAKTNNVPVYAVGLDATNTINFSEMERIASETGGLFRSNISSGDLNDYFSKLYNAFTAQGCVQLNLATAPATGSTIEGTLTLDITDTGKAAATLNVPFSYTAR